MFSEYSKLTHPKKCNECNGKGKVKVNKKITITIPETSKQSTLYVGGFVGYSAASKYQNCSASNIKNNISIQRAARVTLDHCFIALSGHSVTSQKTVFFI